MQKSNSAQQGEWWAAKRWQFPPGSRGRRRVQDKIDKKTGMGGVATAARPSSGAVATYSSGDIMTSQVSVAPFERAPVRRKHASKRREPRKQDDALADFLELKERRLRNIRACAAHLADLQREHGARLLLTLEQT
jgi:hypothetical protein